MSEDLVSFYDEYGFHYKWPQEQIDRYKEISKELESYQMTIWDKYFAKCGGIDKIDTKSGEFKKLMHSGLPICYRPSVWMKYLNLNEQMEKWQDIYQQTFKLTEVVQQRYLITIHKDVPRTFADHKSLKRDELERILGAFTAAHPDIGYCQSINFIAAVLITVLGEEPAYFLLSSIIENYLPEDYYSNGMHGFRVDLQLFEILLQRTCPKLYEHSKMLKNEWMLTVSSWLLTLFSNVFPVTTVLRIWDAFIVDGPEIIFRVAIAFLKLHEEEYIQMDTIGKLNALIGKYENQIINQDELMELAFSLPLKREKLIEDRESALEIIDGKIDPSKKKTGLFHKFFK